MCFQSRRQNEFQRSLHADVGLSAESGRALVLDAPRALHASRMHGSTRELAQATRTCLDVSNAAPKPFS
jgi:hypothetical protein